MNSFAQDEASLLMAAAILSNKEPKDTLPEMEQASRSIVLNRSELPKFDQYHGDTWQLYLDLGFKIISSDDPLFYTVDFPEGWGYKVNGEFWTDIIDENDRIRGSFFYKGPRILGTAYFLPRARFTIGIYLLDKENHLWYGSILDGGKEIFKSEPFSYENGEDMKVYFSLKEKLMNNLPEYEDPLAYWDKEISIDW